MRRRRPCVTMRKPDEQVSVRRVAERARESGHLTAADIRARIDSRRVDLSGMSEADRRRLGAGLAPLLLLAAVLSFAGCAQDRAQAASDAAAGAQALRASIAPVAAGNVAPAVWWSSTGAAILAGIEARLPAASGLPRAEWPAPSMPPALILSAPDHYAASAPAEPPPSTDWWGMIVAGASTIGLGGAAAWALRLTQLLRQHRGALRSAIAYGLDAERAHPDDRNELESIKALHQGAQQSAGVHGLIRAELELEKQRRSQLDAEREALPLPANGIERG